MSGSPLYFYNREYGSSFKSIHQLPFVANFLYSDIESLRDSNVHVNVKGWFFYLKKEPKLIKSINKYVWEGVLVSGDNHIRLSLWNPFYHKNVKDKTFYAFYRLKTSFYKGIYLQSSQNDTLFKELPNGDAPDFDFTSVGVEEVSQPETKQTIIVPVEAVTVTKIESCKFCNSEVFPEINVELIKCLNCGRRYSCSKIVNRVIIDLVVDADKPCAVREIKPFDLHESMSFEYKNKTSDQLEVLIAQPSSEVTVTLDKNKVVDFMVTELANKRQKVD